MEETTDRREIVRTQVREMFEKSAAYRELPKAGRRRIADSTIAVAEAAVGDPLLRPANFPSFVAELIQGTFAAIVDASIQQMEAYADLIQDVASDLDEFMRENSDEEAFDYLRARGVKPDSGRWSRWVASLLLPAARAQAARSRQKLLATIVLMGISRILDPDCDQDD